jgi:Flp pilus assembly pilin Flp
MRDKLHTLYFRLQDLARGESGQDLVEYSLAVAMIAFAATAGMGSVANGINTAFSGISSSLGGYTS